MGSVEDILQLCRLCLVKDQVNIPIFDESSDIRQTFLKISSCLPVKVTREDNLPKRICDECSYKLDMLYIFRNTSTSSEKQLLTWLDQVGLTATAPHTAVSSVTITKPEIQVKQETFDSTEIRHDEDVDAQDYLMQQPDISYQQNFVAFGESSQTDEGPPPKRVKRAAALRQTVQTAEESDEEDMQAALAITKAEGESDDSDEMDDPDYVEAPSTSADDQPGPSGVGKDPIEAPSKDSDVNYSCPTCLEIFPNREEFVKHHMKQYGPTFGCCKCGDKFKTISELYSHLDTHQIEEQPEEVVEEIVLDYEDEETPTSELLYILDDSQCVNEVVIEEDTTVMDIKKEKPLDNVTIVRLEHGYVIPDAIEEVINGKQIQPSTSRVSLTPRPRASQPKRRHVVPDFSSTNYVFMAANKEVDIAHFKCLRCEQLFINKFVFFRHIEKGKCYINNCDVCSATFTKNSEFYHHYVFEHTDRAICNFCFRTFMYEKNVKEHMLRHLDQFRHRCDECNKGFYTVREYRNHYKNRHMGIRHSCTICGRSFADEYYFRRHLATHEQASVVAHAL